MVWYQKANGQSCGTYTPVGIRELEFAQSLQAFPNPTTGHIHFQNHQHNGSAVKIYNTLGQLKRTATIFENRIDFSELPNSMYVLVLQDGGVMRVVKN